MDEKLKAMLDNLTDEQKELVRQCKTPQDFQKMLKGGMFELSDEQLELVAGGDLSWDKMFGCTCHTKTGTPSLCPGLCGPLKGICG